jgi:Mechanosensitive ion channel
VDDIQARATLITTKEGRQVFIPNATLFTNPVAVARQTGKRWRRCVDSHTFRCRNPNELVQLQA